MKIIKKSKRKIINRMEKIENYRYYNKRKIIKNYNNNNNSNNNNNKMNEQ